MELKYILIPNIHRHSEKLKKVLVKYGFSAAFRTNNRLGNLYSKLKYRVDKLHKSNLVYNINCKSCPSVYIGTTGQRLRNRISQHRSDIKNKKDLASSSFLKFK